MSDRDESDAGFVQRILQERAHALSRPKAERSTGEALQVLVLRVGPERYGIEVSRVREVEPPVRPVPVPGAPRGWAGIANLRGEFHWVLDLRSYLDLSGAAGEPKAVMVSAEEAAIGLLVDEVAGLLQVAFDDLKPPLGEPEGRRPGAVRGVTGDLVVLLDVDALVGGAALMVGEAESRRTGNLEEVGG